MNKMMIFPLGFMLILTLFSALYSSGSYIGSSEDYSNVTGISVDDANRTVQIPNAGSKTFNIWTSGLGYAMVILYAAIATGTIAGIKFLGSGLSDLSQSIIFNSILFLGLWAVLSVASSHYMFDSSVTIFIWVGMTTVYIVGMGIHINGNATGD